MVLMELIFWGFFFFCCFYLFKKKFFYNFLNFSCLKMVLHALWWRNSHLQQPLSPKSTLTSFYVLVVKTSACGLGGQMFNPRPRQTILKNGYSDSCLVWCRHHEVSAWTNCSDISMLDWVGHLSRARLNVPVWQHANNCPTSTVSILHSCVLFRRQQHTHTQDQHLYFSWHILIISLWIPKSHLLSLYFYSKMWIIL